ncbi:MAG: putative short-subunit dehydrogenase-like oxidoreductase (DUF2520 family) [Myxococcota bacterium]|jgi:predicted short-subunit dehydrogenase-like oxidoreductase (DUF2520 family)
MSAVASALSPRLALGMVGRGRAARTLAPLLQAAGHTLTWWWSRGDKTPVDGLAETSVVLFAVPDGAIGQAAAKFATRKGAPNEVWLHLSGSRPGRIVRVSGAVPWAAGCLHPLVTLTGSDSAKHLAGATAAIDGDATAVRVATTLAHDLGLVPTPIASDQKALYHAGAVTVAGHATALLTQAMVMLEAAGFTPDGARQALVPLMRGAVANLEAMTPQAAVTGPIARGDVPTVRAHLKALSSLPDPALGETYRRLATTALTLSKQGLTVAQHDALQRVLQRESP